MVTPEHPIAVRQAVVLADCGNDTPRENPDYLRRRRRAFLTLGVVG